MAPSSAARTGREVSGFDRRVYELVVRIPRGRVTTYGRVARALRCGSARAVAQALRRNPWAPRVPCHRVIAADLRPGGFRGKATGARVREKLRLLRDEGVGFTGGRLAEPERIWEP